MTEPKSSTQTIITFTKRQVKALIPLLAELNQVADEHSPGAVIAQVYRDGMFVTVLTAEEARNVARVLKGNNEYRISNSLANRTDRIGFEEEMKT